MKSSISCLNREASRRNHVAIRLAYYHIALLTVVPHPRLLQLLPLCHTKTPVLTCYLEASIIRTNLTRNQLLLI
jgi:hypothetical protein